MCGGKDHTPPPEPVRLHTLDRPSGGGATRPPSSHQRERPQSSRRERPPSSRRGSRPPSSSSSSYPHGSSERPSSSSHRERPPSSHKDKRPPSSGRGRPSSRDRPQTSRRPEQQGRSRIEPIPEHRPIQYTQDTTIVDLASRLRTLIDQHTENFFPRSSIPGTQFSTPELDDPRTRHAAIRQYIARAIVDLVVMSGRYGTSIRRTLLPNSTSLTKSQVET
jgi:hypothetical protein